MNVTTCGKRFSQHALAFVLLILVSLAITPDAKAQATPIRNVVLVHGAYADGSGWKGVYEALTRKGFNVTIVQNPLSSLEDDVAATNLQTKPAYGIVATDDKSIQPDIQRNMYKRSGTKVTEMKGSHVVFMSHPGAVAAVIEQAANGKR